MQPTTTPQHADPFGPFRVGIFRALWLAVLVSNIGSWMQTVGAQWLLVEQHASPTIVALVQTASSVPVLLLGIPAGVVAEFVNRRRLLIGVQAFQVVVGALLTLLTAIGEMTPALLLLLTFLVGTAAAVQLPAYQALVPEIVPREMIRDAASLSSVGVNIARAIGPAVAGLLIARAGVAVVFSVNVATFLIFLLVLLAWRGYTPPVAHDEPFLDATRAGLRYVRNSAVVRQILMQLAIFMIPANALWALLPLLASGHLRLAANGYGLLLAALGAGAVGGAFVMPSLRRRLGIGPLVVLASAVFGAVMIVITWATSLWVILPFLIVAGMAWIGVITTLNGTVQAFLPVWVRARGLSVYQLVLFGSTAIGAAAAGAFASWAGVTVVLALAGALTVLTGVRLLIRPLPETDLDRSHASIPMTDIPQVLVDADDQTADRKTLVIVRYTVDAERREAFLRIVELLGRSRRRTGATTWNLYDDAAEPNVFFEAFTVASWREHLDQHQQRLTGHDQQLLDGAHSLSNPAPTVQHLLAIELESMQHAPRSIKRGFRRGSEHA